MLNIRNLPISEPITLYADLNKAIEYGEGYATTKIKPEYESELGEGYLLGGLEVTNLNDAGLNEETLARLSNALDTDNVRYALFPNDQRRGQLPLILDERTRSYITSHLEELISNNFVKWHLYVLPNDIDPDNNEKSGSIKVTDSDDEPLVVNYEKIAMYLELYGYVNDNDEDEAFEDVPEEDEALDNDVDEEISDEEARRRKSIELPSVNNDPDNYYKELFFEDEEETEEDEDEQEDVPDEEEKASILEDESEETDSNGESEEQIDEESKENLLNFEDEEDINFDEENNVTSAVESSEKNAVDEVNETVREYTSAPPELDELLNSVKIPRFNEFPSEGIHEVTKNTIQKEIDDANSRIEVLEEDIKREAKKVYQEYMANSFESINKELDIENGNDTVTNFYNKVKQKQEEFDNKLEQDVENRRLELREEFYGPKLEDYKQELLAKARQWHEDEHFEDEVENPLKKYREERESHYSNKKRDERSEFDLWAETMEDVAKGKDQADAIIRANEVIQQATVNAQKDIKQSQERIDDIYHELTLIEYQQRSEENIRKSVGQSLHTDEQAKIYQKEVEQLLTERASTETEHKKYITEMKEKEKLEKEQHQKDIQEIEDNHKKILEDYKDQIDAINKEKQEISQSYNDEKLINNNDKKKSIFKFGIPSFLAAALLFGGGGAIISNVGDSEQEQEMKKQSNKIEEQEKSIKSKEKELEEQQKAQEKQEDELNKAKKEAEEAKKDKKDKDKKKD